MRSWPRRQIQRIWRSGAKRWPTDSSVTPSGGVMWELLVRTLKLALLPFRDEVGAGALNGGEVVRAVRDHGVGLDRDHACVSHKRRVACCEFERVTDAEVEGRDRCIAGRFVGPFGATPAPISWRPPDRCDTHPGEVPELEAFTEAPDHERRDAGFSGHLRLAGRATAALWPHNLMVSAAGISGRCLQVGFRPVAVGDAGLQDHSRTLVRRRRWCDGLVG